MLSHCLRTNVQKLCYALHFIVYNCVFYNKQYAVYIIVFQIFISILYKYNQYII